MPTVNAMKENAYREGVLQYYNTVLLEKGLISQSEYRAMQMKIRSAYAPAVKDEKYAETYPVERLNGVSFLIRCIAFSCWKWYSLL